MKSKISTQEMIIKQKEQEEKERKNEKIKRENLQQTKNSNIEKESNIKTIKKVAKREGYPGETNGRSKNPKPTSRNKAS